MSAAAPVIRMMIGAIPPPRVTDVVAWAAANVKLPGSARCERFDPEITPWTREPLARIDDGVTRRIVFVKPVQAGGSVVGEIAVCYWIAQKPGGDIQYNWQNDDNAEDRYEKRIEKILKACPAVMRRWPDNPNKAKKGLVIFGHCNLMVQGVFTKRRVASDSVKYQVNEEVHDEEGWLSGRLDQAFGRLTASWDSRALVISNAGRKNSELHKAFAASTAQRWEVKCPGCGMFHVMRTRWEDSKPELGGLRYDSDAARTKTGYDYNLLAPTIRYQFPCGHTVPDDITIRRALSLSGQYGPPTNPGAPITDRGFTLEAVSVDYIPWLSIIKQKHEALKALKHGDSEPWKVYLRERECLFADDSDRPVVGKIIFSSVVKERAGLEGRMARYAAIDRQRGSLRSGEVPHWWMVIRDVMETGDSRLVFEGQVMMDEDVVDILKRHEVCPRHVVVDSGDDTTHVYQFCLRYGYNAIKGGRDAFFSHEIADPKGKGTISVKRIYSPERPLHAMLGAPPTCADPGDEPQFWLYSKSGIRDRLHWLRGSKEIRWEVPSDVSDDYQAHMEAEVMEEDRDSRGYSVTVWKQIRDRNDLFVCECYIAMLMDMAGLIGTQEGKA